MIKHRLKKKFATLLSSSALFVMLIATGKHFFSKEYIWQITLAVAILWMARVLYDAISYVLEGEEERD